MIQLILFWTIIVLSGTSIIWAFVVQPLLQWWEDKKLREELNRRPLPSLPCMNPCCVAARKAKGVP